MLKLADLPNDIDALTALLWAREVEVAGLKAQLNIVHLLVEGEPQPQPQPLLGVV